MHNILIVCDGREIKIQTKRNVREVCRLLRFNSESDLLLINSELLEDEEFKGELALAPSKVTLIKDITEEENMVQGVINQFIDNFPLDERTTMLFKSKLKS